MQNNIASSLNANIAITKIHAVKPLMLKTLCCLDDKTFCTAIPIALLILGIRLKTTVAIVIIGFRSGVFMISRFRVTSILKSFVLYM